jgi:DNA-directed RNA polymerase subunit RPC12/RpoP
VAWEEDLAGRLLTALDREAVLAECHCPGCDHRLLAEPKSRDRVLAITVTEETTLRCPRCGFAAAVHYRELTSYHTDRSVTIDGRVVREDHRRRPGHEVSGLDEAGEIIW